MKYTMHSTFNENAKPIHLEVDDKTNVVTSCDKEGDGPNGGMAWVERYTKPYGDKPTMRLLQHAARTSYIAIESDEVKKDDDSEVGVVEVAKTDEDKRLVFGWAYQTHDKDGKLIVDKSGEYVDDPEELEEAAYGFVLKNRVQGDSHGRDLETNIAKQVGSMVESVVFTPEKIAKMGIPAGTMPTGWWVGFKVDDDDAWQAVKNGQRKSFSIHGKAVRKET